MRALGKVANRPSRRGGQAILSALVTSMLKSVKLPCQ